MTTNYDCVLQWSNPAARVATNSQPAKLADLFAGSSKDQPIVWHLHGHVEDTDGLIPAPHQYERLYREAIDDKHPYAAAWLQLRTLIANHPLLFLGFGLQDVYVMDAPATVLEIFGGFLRPSYALLLAGDDRARTNTRSKSSSTPATARHWWSCWRNSLGRYPPVRQPATTWAAARP